MKVQIVSDIHGECYNTFEFMNRIEKKADVIVIAGDIHSRNYEDTLGLFSQRYEHVIALYGNHEWYRRDISWRADPIRIPDNVHILDRDIFQLDDVVFIGATLWSDFKNADWFVMDAAKRGINDFHVIQDTKRGNTHGKFTPQRAHDFHLLDHNYIKMMIENLRQQDGKKIVVCTHFMPSYSVVDAKWKRNPGTDTLNWYFTAQCDDLIEMEGVRYWLHGHSHDPCDLKLGRCRVIRNPMGYPGEGIPYKDKAITIK